MNWQKPSNDIYTKQNKKSGNWGLDEIDCHRSHKEQCTSKKYFFSYVQKTLKKKFETKNLEKEIFEKIFFEKKKKFWKKKFEKFFLK